MTPADRTLLAQTLALIEETDPSAHGAENHPTAAERYADRNRMVLQALAIAARGGYDAGVAIDPAQPDWPVVYIVLPDVGQVSWHIPAWAGEWDGHDGPAKSDRIRSFIAATCRCPLCREAGPAVTVEDLETDLG